MRKNASSTSFRGMISGGSTRTRVRANNSGLRFAAFALCLPLCAPLGRILSFCASWRRVRWCEGGQSNSKIFNEHAGARGACESSHSPQPLLPLPLAIASRQASRQSRPDGGGCGCMCATSGSRCVPRVGSRGRGVSSVRADGVDVIDDHSLVSSERTAAEGAGANRSSP